MFSNAPRNLLTAPASSPTRGDDADAKCAPSLLSSGVPAKAGTHFSEARAAEGWVPAFAGTPV